MNKSKLIDKVAASHGQLSSRDVELAVKIMLDHITETLAAGERIEIRGFGSFSLRHRDSRIGRNPRTGEQVVLPSKRVPHFKPGKGLRERVAKTLPGARVEAEPSFRRLGS